MARAAPAVVLQLGDLGGQGSRPGVLQGLAWALVSRAVPTLGLFLGQRGHGHLPAGVRRAPLTRRLPGDRSVTPLDAFDRARPLRLLLFAARPARGGVQLNLLLAGLLSQEQTQVLDVIAV